MKKSNLNVHLSWTICLLFLTVIFVSSLRLSDNQDIVNILSISGSIVSIILAIVTIVYSFYQNLSTTNLHTTMATTLASLDQKVDNMVIRINGNKILSSETQSHDNLIDFTRVHGIYNTSNQLNTKEFVENIKFNLKRVSQDTTLIDYSVYNLKKSVDDMFSYSTSVCLFFSGKLDNDLKDFIIDQSMTPISGSYNKIEYTN